jgi:glycerol-3-phosphate dehydrogenase
MAAAPLDLLVIGGGITGAGVARDAALRGMRVGLVEKGDFGCGTSSRSSKIIHGGVRYLEYLQFGLVQESARERRILERVAPHLVHPLPFLYPVFAGESLLKIQAGLKLFDQLAGTPREQRSRHLSPSDTREYLPGLRDPLKGAVLYSEYITDDARFTLANIASAALHGARVANYVRASGFIRSDGRVAGAQVVDLENGRALEIRAAVTVNATGPWVQEVLQEAGLPVPKQIVPSKGIHILLERSRLPLTAATFLRSSTGRRGLAMPRGPWVYVGTSDTEYREDLDDPLAQAAEIAELLEMTRDCFPEAKLETKDVKGFWAGIRPLIFEKGKSTRDTSRHDEVWISPPGLVTVAGGKLTTYRPMAHRILEGVAETLGRVLPGVERSAEVPLPGAPSELSPP